MPDLVARNERRMARFQRLYRAEAFITACWRSWTLARAIAIALMAWFR